MAALRSPLPWLALAASVGLLLALAARPGAEAPAAVDPLAGPGAAGSSGGSVDLARPSRAASADGPGDAAPSPSGARRLAEPTLTGRVGEAVGPLRGRVRHADSGEPAAGLCFWLEQPELWAGGVAAAHVTTDAEGRFVTEAGFRRAQVHVGFAEPDCGSGDRGLEVVPRRVQATGAPLELYAYPPRVVLHVRVQDPEGRRVPRPQVALVPAPAGRTVGFVREIDGARFYFDQDHVLFEDLARSRAEVSVFPIFDGQLRELGTRVLLRSHSGPALRFGTAEALSLEGLSGEVHHTFRLQPRPTLAVRLLDAAGEFDPTGVEVVARFASGDEALAELGRKRDRWEFSSGWCVPGRCDVLVVGANSRRVLTERTVQLKGGEEHVVDVHRAELPLTPGAGEPFVALAGRVLDEEGEPLRDVELEALWLGGSRPVFSGRDGAFRLFLRARVGPITLRVAEDVAAGRFEPAERTVAFGARELEIRRVSRDEVALRLRCVDAVSRTTLLGLRHVQLHRTGSLPRVDVGLLDCDPDEPLVEGSYARGVGASYVVRVPHYRTLRGRLPRDGRGERLDLTLHLARGFRDELLVVDGTDGEPLDGVVVRTFAGARLGVTGPDGRVVVQAPDWPEGLVFEEERHAPFRWRLDWEGLCEGVDGRIELSWRRR